MKIEQGNGDHSHVGNNPCFQQEYEYGKEMMEMESPKGKESCSTGENSLKIHGQWQEGGNGYDGRIGVEESREYLAQQEGSFDQDINRNKQSMTPFASYEPDNLESSTPVYIVESNRRRMGLGQAPQNQKKGKKFC